jgi:ABC-type transport system involved in cytochrome c biogenesis ATPase subunit
MVLEVAKIWLLPPKIWLADEASSAIEKAGKHQ